MNLTERRSVSYTGMDKKQKSCLQASNEKNGGFGGQRELELRLTGVLQGSARTAAYLRQRQPYKPFIFPRIQVCSVRKIDPCNCVTLM